MLFIADHYKGLPPHKVKKKKKKEPRQTDSIKRQTQHNYSTKSIPGNCLRKMYEDF